MCKPPPKPHGFYIQRELDPLETERARIVRRGFRYAERIGTVPRIITTAAHGLPGGTQSRRLDQVAYGPTSVTAGQYWDAYSPPTWAQWLEILMMGCGGGGGDAVAGAASTAGGGGGGGSGGMTRLLINLTLFRGPFHISVAGLRTAGQKNNTTTTAVAGVSSYVAIAQTVGAPIANNVIAQVNSGASGGKSNAGTAGPVGTAATIATAAQMPLGFVFAQVLAGQVGIIGGAAVAGAALTLPVTGLIMTGGTGGGGLGAVSTAGKAGGLITGVTGFLPVPANIPGGAGGTTAPTAGLPGVTGGQWWEDLQYCVGGTGGGSSGLAAATGAAGGNGGHGGLGCGAGGGGAAFTASAFGIGGGGGDSRVWMTAF